MSTSPPKHYWRTLAELADDPLFRERVEEEFPAAKSHASQLAGARAAADPSRREFMKFLGASLALGGFTGCVRQPDEKIVPYVEMPEYVVPGQPLFFATAMPRDGFGSGILVESHAGRPRKVEGNPQHPASLGATQPSAQASVLDLYDPDRSQVLTQRGQISSWPAFVAELRRQLARLKIRQGRGLHVLAEASTSPTLAAQFEEFRRQFPNAKWHTYEIAGGAGRRAGVRLAYDADLLPLYDLNEADVILSLDADFLVDGPGHLRYARQFADRRNGATSAPEGTARSVVRSVRGTLDASSRRMNRLYVVESTPTLTGAAADHRWGMRASDIEAFARSLAKALGVPAAAGIESDAPIPNAAAIETLADDLRGGGKLAEGSAALVLAGESQPPPVHALAHAINEHLGSTGKAVTWIDALDVPRADEAASLGDLVADMQNGDVELLLILGGNPVYTAPHDLGFADALRQVPFTVHHSLYYDETSAACHWHVPAAHFLETWSDIRALDGTATIMQPLIAPLYAGKSVHEVLSAVMGRADRSAHELVQATWRESYEGSDFDAFWQTALHDGVVPDSSASPRKVKLRDGLAERLPMPATQMTSVPDRIDVVFRCDPTIGDGRFANNGWLQELPKPFTKLTWGTAALIGPPLAERLNLQNEDVVEISRDGKSILVPVWIVPGSPDGVVTLHLGHGRSRAGRVGTGVGVDVSPLRRSDSPWTQPGVTLRKTGAKQPLACTAEHHLMDGRDLIRSGTWEEYVSDPQHPPFMHSARACKDSGDFRKSPESLRPRPEGSSSFYPDYEHEGPAWGMSVNLGACIGCNACVIACQAENNIPVVGREEVRRGREMHWLRIDTYHAGNAEHPDTFHQPVMCMHCERAPCEPVCPVAATTHSDEGLNEMTYNRCVGTRYCSNNCPYKVRRFNFLDYQSHLHDEPVLQLLQNPDVTVRSRGVMEKCTYCVQRINAARISAEKEDRDIRDGEVVTACQAACPTRAIVFGDVSKPDSAVARRKESPLDYALLEELNTRPRTSYLAVVKNPHPHLARATHSQESTNNTQNSGVRSQKSGS